jgi:hypothetical protein
MLRKNRKMRLRFFLAPPTIFLVFVGGKNIEREKNESFFWVQKYEIF